MSLQRIVMVDSLDGLLTWGGLIRKFLEDP